MMTGAILSDIFIIVAISAIVLITFPLVVALLYIINVLREVLIITRRARDTSGAITAVINKIFRRNKHEHTS